MSDNRKDKNFIRFLCVTALVGAVNILLNGVYTMLLVYVPCMAISIPTLYFNYSLCKWENKWHGLVNEKNPCDGEPSKYRLVTGKVGEWFLFGLGLVLSLITLIVY